MRNNMAAGVSHHARQNLHPRPRCLAWRLGLVRGRPAQGARTSCVHPDPHGPRRAGAPAAPRHQSLAAHCRRARPDQIRTAHRFRLVGHSYGGCVISGVAEAVPDTIRSIVFLDAFIPDNGDATVDLVQPAVQEIIQAALERGDTTVPVRSAAAFNVNENDRAWVDLLAGPQPIGTMTEKIRLTGARERIPKKTYIRASGYPNVSFEKAHARAKANPNWRTYEVPCGHDVMIDAPDRLTDILLEVG